MDEKELLENYRAEFTDLNSTRSEVFRDFDRTLVTLSTASLGFTVVVAKDIFKISESPCAWLMICSWILFAFSSIICLSSMLMSGHGHDKQISMLEEKFRGFAKLIRKRREAPQTIGDDIIKKLDKPFAWIYFDLTKIQLKNATEKEIKSESSKSIKQNKKDARDENIWINYINIANWMSLFSFLLAVGLFLVYISYRSPKTNSEQSLLLKQSSSIIYRRVL